DGPDQGVDVIATKNKEKYAFQCKRWNKKVGNKAIQEIYAGKDYYGLQHAIVITNPSFTDSAKQLAKKLNVQLWDRDTLAKQIETYHYKKR
ncbi:MAG: restriction endonuclease, partial [Enterococcus sp.]|nr:restriction endonuclease [Enterococcus sp.]